ncbi:MAG: hypothetical protein ACREBW_06460 [Candidatus Micrarchaeaceae archaeon]
MFVAYIPYIRDVIKQKTHPHIYSWFIWGLLSLLIALLQFQKGAGFGAYVTATAGLISMVVCFLGIRNGKKDITAADTAVLMAALIATGIWLVTKQPLTSMILLVGAGALGSIPTIRKTWHKPHQETLFYWALSPIRHACSIGAIASYNVVTLLNPMTLIVINGGLCLVIVMRRHNLKP